MPIYFTTPLPPESVIQRLMTHAHESPPILRIIWRNRLRFGFTQITPDRWTFSGHSQTRRENIRAWGEIQRVEPDLTLVVGHTEWNRATYWFLAICYILWFGFGLALSALLHSAIVFWCIAIGIGLLIAWNVGYTRRRAQRFSTAIESMIRTEPAPKRS
jgi:hypothetical protein